MKAWIVMLSLLSLLGCGPLVGLQAALGAELPTARGPQSSGTQSSGTQSPGTQLPGTQLPGTQLPGTQLPGTQLPGTQLPGTGPLAAVADRSQQMRDGFQRYLRAELQAVRDYRPQFWKRDQASVAAYRASVQPQRRRLERMIGAVDPRVAPPRLELIGQVHKSAVVRSSRHGKVVRVRWPVFPLVQAEGLLVEPSGKPRATLILLPDADEPPEAYVGLAPGAPSGTRLVGRLLASGCRVLVPTLIDRRDTHSGFPSVGFTNQPHREWIYRQAFEMGRHIIGYEVQQTRALIDWVSHDPAMREAPLAVAGYAEGGLLALYVGALDERVDAVLVSGYFNDRRGIFEEPLYRNLFGLLRQFGDAELGSLMAPRPLIVEHAQPPRVSGPPQTAGRRRVAAPGRIESIDFKGLAAEVNRCRALFPAEGRVAMRLRLIHDRGRPVGPWSEKAEQALRKHLKLPEASGEETWPKAEASESVSTEIAARQARLVRGWVRHTQDLLRHSERVREDFWKDARPDATAKVAARLDAWKQQTAFYRRYLRDKIVGQIPAAEGPLNPRTRKLKTTDRWTAYEVVLDVRPDIFCWGYLLIPNDLKPGERRPVVVCQHGLEGQPASVIDRNPQSSDYRVYKGFAAELADQGFVTYAPHNFYRGRNAFRRLQRLAHPLRSTLFALTTAQHGRHLEWLSSLPFVDPKRIGFYGLSYGGNTAMRVPALLPQYATVVCSGDFNDWIYKNATVDHIHSMIYHNVWEVFEWNLGHTFNHSDLASLIAPRPFMVERGHDDGVALDEWVAREYARVRRRYVKLGIGERTEIEFFNGPHAIHGEGTYRFLQRTLKWKPKGREK